MKILKKQINLPCDAPIIETCFTDSSLFIDIETTGFSRTNTHVYLIGCAAKREYMTELTQFFAETPNEERQILCAFLEFSSQYKQIISFHGTGFDIPYLKERCALYNLTHSLDNISHFDIYHKLSPFKSILKLENLKQKSLEQFADVGREDQYSGGELIELYLDYTKHPSKEQGALLLLHNYEDLLGMIKILPLLAYPEFFAGQFEVISYEERVCKTCDYQQAKELILTLSPAYPLPKHISCSNENIYLTASEHLAKLKLPVYQGELKHFYPNYREYYYLPHEDRAIHKSVALYVDRNFRTKAKTSTCYIRKTGDFLPQYLELNTPCFKEEYSGKVSWFELTNDFLASSERLKNYALHILTWLSKIR